jgi:hypothetical protein
VAHVVAQLAQCRRSAWHGPVGTSSASGTAAMVHWHGRAEILARWAQPTKNRRGTLLKWAGAVHSFPIMQRFSNYQMIQICKL